MKERKVTKSSDILKGDECQELEERGKGYKNGKRILKLLGMNSPKKVLIGDL